MLLAKNIEAGRLVAWFTISEPGNWTSWPLHEHAKMLEEMYVYFDMPDPAFGIQLVYNHTDYPEIVTVVRDGDAVLMPSGYHPNVSVTGHRDLLSLGNGDAPRGRRPAVWCGERAVRIRSGIFRIGSRT